MFNYFAAFVGIRLGGDEADNWYPGRQAVPPATRSWGYGPRRPADLPGGRPDDTFSDQTEYSTTYGGEEPDLAEAIHRSYNSYRAEESGSERYTPSAPPYHDEQEERGVWYPDLVGERPPLYPTNPGPPPRGGWRMPLQPRFGLVPSYTVVRFWYLPWLQQLVYSDPHKIQHVDSRVII